MKILVTGGAGFIGSHVVDAYIEKGHQVSVVDNLVSGKKENLNPAAKFYQIDICEREQMEKVFKTERHEVVNHHAAQIDVRKSVADPAYDARINILGMLNLLECARIYGVKKFIFASSGGVMYGEPEKLPCSESDEISPLSPYGVTKRCSELYLKYYRATYSLDYVALRYGNVYGPRQDPYGEAGVVAIFCRKMLSGQTPTIYGDGEQLRDYVFVADVARANVLALKHKGEGIYNIGTGVGSSVNLLYEELKKITGFETIAKYGPKRAGEIYRSCLDCRRAAEKLGWQPLVNFREGLKKTVEYFKQKAWGNPVQSCRKDRQSGEYP